ncbi:MAG: hypothetical protein ACJAYU_003267 [Bradymonadia bacterium]
MTLARLLELRALHEAARCEALTQDSGPFVYRVTEGINVPTVLAHGSDRWGRPERELNWNDRGYTGSPKLWSELIYASTDTQIVASLSALDGPSSAFRKVDISPNPHVAVYRAEHFVWVRDRELALAPGCTFLGALLFVAKAELPLIRVGR